VAVHQHEALGLQEKERNSKQLEAVHQHEALGLLEKESIVGTGHQRFAARPHDASVLFPKCLNREKKIKFKGIVICSILYQLRIIFLLSIIREDVAKQTLVTR